MNINTREESARLRSSGNTLKLILAALLCGIVIGLIVRQHGSIADMDSVLITVSPKGSGDTLSITVAELAMENTLVVSPSCHHCRRMMSSFAEYEARYRIRRVLSLGSYSDSFDLFSQSEYSGDWLIVVNNRSEFMSSIPRVPVILSSDATGKVHVISPSIEN